jgi:hypothetical protein
MNPRRSALAPPPALRRRQLAQLVIRVGQFAAYLGELRLQLQRFDARLPMAQTL